MNPESFWLALKVNTPVIATAAAVYFWARLGHYLALALGIPYLRTLIWTVSWAAEMRSSPGRCSPAEPDVTHSGKSLAE